MSRALTLDDWRQDPKRRMALRDLLAHPVLVEAFDTIRDCARPRVPAPVRGDDFSNSETVLTDIALRHAHRAGIYDVPRLLDTLTQMAEAPVAAPPQPWGSLMTEDEIEAQLTTIPKPTRRRRKKSSSLPVT